MPNFPKRPQSHVIGDDAVSIFTSACPREWIVSPVQPDYGLDLRVELTRDGNVTGEEFYVQLKGRKEVKESSGEAVEVPISQSTINYWLGKVHPVLIVLVDVSRRCFWFQWLEYAYPHFPNQREEKEDVKLLLHRSSVTDPLAERVTKYLSDYFSQLRADFSKTFESTQVTRMLFHVTRLWELCARIGLFLQSVPKELSDEQILEQWRWYAKEFGWHDYALRIPWQVYARQSYGRSQNIVLALESRLKVYEELRGTFYKLRDPSEVSPDTETFIPEIPEESLPKGINWTFRLVHFDYEWLVKNLFPTMNVLRDTQEILFHILLIGRVKFKDED
jgi:hypothetical protein